MREREREREREARLKINTHITTARQAYQHCTEAELPRGRPRRTRRGPSRLWRPGCEDCGRPHPPDPRPPPARVPCCSPVEQDKTYKHVIGVKTKWFLTACLHCKEKLQDTSCTSSLLPARCMHRSLAAYLRHKMRVLGMHGDQRQA